MNNLQVSNKRRIFEILAVIFTGLGKLLFVDFLDMKFAYIIVAILFWIGYFILRTARHKELIRYWGLSFFNAKDTFRIVGFIGFVVVCVFIVYAISRHTFVLSWNILFVLITYPIWGLVQQFLMMSLFAGNLKDYEGKQLHNFFIIGLTSVMFSVVHYPTLPLIAVTFVMAAFYSALFIHKRNIIPLGIFHGLLGGLFYYFILNRDPWLEFLKMIKK